MERVMKSEKPVRVSGKLRKIYHEVVHRWETSTPNHGPVNNKKTESNVPKIPDPLHGPLSNRYTVNLFRFALITNTVLTCDRKAGGKSNQALLKGQLGT